MSVPAELSAPPHRRAQGLAAQIAAALLCGAIFGFGLALSGMMDPARVRGFLDIFGRFDPSLAFVLAGAVAVSAAGAAVAKRLRRPVLDATFHLPSHRAIDPPLIAGAAIFGIGWGMAGLCPGPAVAGLALGKTEFFIFFAALLAGVLLHDFWSRRADAPAALQSAAATPDPAAPRPLEQAGANLFDLSGVSRAAEAFRPLAGSAGVRIERIVSHGQASPPGVWLEEPDAEWAAVLSGAARLRFEDEPSARVLSAGDHVFIAPRRRHRVDWTHPDEATVWLAVHVAAARNSPAQDTKARA